MAAGADEIQVQVVGVFEQEVAFGDRDHRIPIVLLRDPTERELRIPIGSCEGFAIQIAVEQHAVPRPLTHDLGLRLLQTFGARLERVVVGTLSDQEAHATLHLATADGEVRLGARPGDALALALRADAPIYVIDELLSPGGSEPL